MLDQECDVMLGLLKVLDASLGLPTSDILDDVAFGEAQTVRPDVLDGLYLAVRVVCAPDLGA